MGRIRTQWKGLTLGAVFLVIVLAVGIPFVYIHLIEGTQPAALSLNDVPTTAATARGSGTATRADAVAGPGVDGTWKVTTGSAAGYRVKETLAGQGTTAVGRTSDVSGTVTVTGTQVTAATFTVQMASVSSDRSQRDNQFKGRIMNTSQYPTGTFTLTEPIDLGSVPAVGATITSTATGNLTLHGTTKAVTFPVQAKRTATNVALAGDIDIRYGDYKIDNPSIGGFVSVGSGGTIEFLLVTTR